MNPTLDDRAALAALQRRLSTDLTAAMRRRDRPAIDALRALRGAIDNAEAVPVEAPSGAGGGLPVPGLRATEATRRDLDRATVSAIVRAEITERLDAAETYRTRDQAERAARLEAEAAALQPYLDGV